MSWQKVKVLTSLGKMRQSFVMGQLIDVMGEKKSSSAEFLLTTLQSTTWFLLGRLPQLSAAKAAGFTAQLPTQALLASTSRHSLLPFRGTPRAFTQANELRRNLEIRCWTA